MAVSMFEQNFMTPVSVSDDHTAMATAFVHLECAGDLSLSHALAGDANLLNQLTSDQSEQRFSTMQRFA
jgi:hypothetical protein